MRALLLALALLPGGCYPVCVTDGDCKNGYCQIDGQKRQCIACDPADDTRPCTDGRVCAAFNMCVACTGEQDCGDGYTCADDGTCQAICPGDDGGTDDGGTTD